MVDAKLPTPGQSIEQRLQGWAPSLGTAMSLFRPSKKAFSEADLNKNAVWLRGQIKDELDRWTDPESRRGSRD